MPFQKGNKIGNKFKKGNKIWLKKKHTKATKKKMSEAQKGKHPKTEFKKGNVNGFKRGNKHPNWKGGISSENSLLRVSIEYRLWRESVFARDGWLCCKCSERGCLNAHHIKNFYSNPELRFAIDNGITFCQKCHRKFHNKYGRKNNTQEQIFEFIRYNNLIK